MNYNGIKSVLSFTCDDAMFAPLRSVQSHEGICPCAKTTHTSKPLTVDRMRFYFSPDFRVYIILNSIYVMIRTDTNVSAVSTAHTATNRYFTCG